MKTKPISTTVINPDIRHRTAISLSCAPKTGRMTPQGNPRLPSDHCAAIINAYGNDGNHLGRIIGLMSSEVCYMSPQVRAHLGMSRMPEPDEYEPSNREVPEEQSL